MKAKNKIMPTHEQHKKNTKTQPSSTHKRKQKHTQPTIQHTQHTKTNQRNTIYEQNKNSACKITQKPKQEKPNAMHVLQTKKKTITAFIQHNTKTHTASMHYRSPTYLHLLLVPVPDSVTLTNGSLFFGFPNARILIA